MELITKNCIIEKFEGMTADVMTFVLYDDSVYDRDFEKVLVSGIDTSNFMKNPVMLLQHKSHHTPIGRWQNVRVEGTKLLADAIFDETTLDDDELVAIDKVKKGFLKAVSIGFMPTAPAAKIYPDPGTPEAEALSVVAGYRDCYRVYEKCELYEASIVTLPSNPNAIRIKSFEKAGASISSANKEILKECLKLCGEHQKAHGDLMKSAIKGHTNAMSSIQEKISALIGNPDQEPEEGEGDEGMQEDSFATIKQISEKLDKLIAGQTKDTVFDEDETPDGTPATNEDQIEDEDAELDYVELSLEKLKSFLLSKKGTDYDS